jgi:hypothetical protein
LSDQKPIDALCAQVQGKLSAFADGELAELDRLGVERHLEDCAACRLELEELRRLSAFLERQGRQVPEPPAWEAVAATVADRSPPAGALRAWRRADFAIAASLATLALLGLLVARLSRGPEPRLSGTATAKLEEVQMLTAGLPGLDTFLAARGAKEVAPREISQRVGFEPQIPDRLPGGFELAKTYVVFDRCCAGSCLIYRRGQDVIGLVQQPSSHPIAWNIENLEGCTIAGRFCRRGSDRQVEIVQIEPEGRNLTVVAKAGVIDTAALVRALTVN